MSTPTRTRASRKSPAERSAEIADMEAALSDPGLYRRDPAKFAATGEALARARAEVSAMEEEWLRIESLREELERNAG